MCLVWDVSAKWHPFPGWHTVVSHMPSKKPGYSINISAIHFIKEMFKWSTNLPFNISSLSFQLHLSHPPTSFWVTVRFFYFLFSMSGRVNALVWIRLLGWLSLAVPFMHNTCKVSSFLLALQYFKAHPQTIVYLVRWETDKSSGIKLISFSCQSLCMLCLSTRKQG